MHFQFYHFSVVTKKRQYDAHTTSSKFRGCQTHVTKAWWFFHQKGKDLAAWETKNSSGSILNPQVAPFICLTHFVKKMRVVNPSDRLSKSSVCFRLQTTQACRVFFAFDPICKTMTPPRQEGSGCSSPPVMVRSWKNKKLCACRFSTTTQGCHSAVPWNRVHRLRKPRCKHPWLLSHGGAARSATHIKATVINCLAVFSFDGLHQTRSEQSAFVTVKRADTVHFCKGNTNISRHACCRKPNSRDKQTNQNVSRTNKTGDMQNDTKSNRMIDLAPICTLNKLPLSQLL